MGIRSIELRPDLEQRLAEQARAQGMTLSPYLQTFLGNGPGVCRKCRKLNRLKSGIVSFAGGLKSSPAKRLSCQIKPSAETPSTTNVVVPRPINDAGVPRRLRRHPVAGNSNFTTNAGDGREALFQI
jgi:hypothetical protein